MVVKPTNYMSKESFIDSYPFLNIIRAYEGLAGINRAFFGHQWLVGLMTIMSIL